MIPRSAATASAAVLCAAGWRLNSSRQLHFIFPASPRQQITGAGNIDQPEPTKGQPPARGLALLTSKVSPPWFLCSRCPYQSVPQRPEPSHLLVQLNHFSELIRRGQKLHTASTFFAHRYSGKSALVFTCTTFS